MTLRPRRSGRQRHTFTRGNARAWRPDPTPAKKSRHSLGDLGANITRSPAETPEPGAQIRHPPRNHATASAIWAPTSHVHLRKRPTPAPRSKNAGTGFVTDDSRGAGTGEPPKRGNSRGGSQPARSPRRFHGSSARNFAAAGCGSIGRARPAVGSARGPRWTWQPGHQYSSRACSPRRRTSTVSPHRGTALSVSTVDGETRAASGSAAVCGIGGESAGPRVATVMIRSMSARASIDTGANGCCFEAHRISLRNTLPTPLATC